MKSTKELKELLSLVIEVINVADIVGDEDGINFSDIGYIWNVVEKLGPACKGLNEVPAEMADLDSGEVQELIDFVVSDLQIQNSKAKKIIEQSLKAVKACYEVYLAVRV